jgi:20S proteasome alpha/beta subunit
MTIAAGFRCKDGVLVGADTRIEEGDVKYQENKVFDITPDGFRGFGIALAGAGDFNEINTCVDLMRDGRLYERADSMLKLKKALRDFVDSGRYQRLIKPKKPPTQGFDAILGLRTADGKTDLLYLYNSNLYPIPTYRCIGAGHQTALFVSKWLYSPDYSIRAFVPLALNIFRAAKDNNSGCDDLTRIATLYNGTWDVPPITSTWPEGDFMWGINDLLRPIVRGCVDARIPEHYFESSIKNLIDRLRAVRHSTEMYWRPIILAEKLSPQPTTADQSPPPPSPESPEESGES